jgi:hypothetical protein
VHPRLGPLLLFLAAIGAASAAASTGATPTPGWAKSGEPLEDQVAIFPNPCAAIEATVAFALKADAPVRLVVYNSAGAVVQETSHAGVAGENRLPIDLRRASPGVYYVVVRVRESAASIVTLPPGKPVKFVRL